MATERALATPAFRRMKESPLRRRGRAHYVPEIAFSLGRQKGCLGAAHPGRAVAGLRIATCAGLRK